MPNLTQPLVLDFNALPSGVAVLMRTAKGDTADGSGPNWTEPFEGKLLIEKNAQGRAVAVSIADSDFAEFDPRYSLEDDGELLEEDYHLQVLALL